MKTQIKDLAKQHLVTLYEMIKEKRNFAKIEEIVKWYSTFYGYAKFCILTGLTNKEIRLKEMLEDSIIFLLQTAEKQKSLETTRVVMYEVNNLMIFYQQIYEE